MPKFYPDIFEYLHDDVEGTSIDLSDIKPLLYRIRAKTGLDINIIELIVKHYFLEIRKAALTKKIVYISGIGKFYISNKKRIFPKLDIHKSFSKRLNNG